MEDVDLSSARNTEQMPLYWKHLRHGCNLHEDSRNSRQLTPKGKQKAVPLYGKEPFA